MRVLICNPALQMSWEGVGAPLPQCTPKRPVGVIVGLRKNREQQESSRDDKTSSGKSGHWSDAMYLEKGRNRIHMQIYSTAFPFLGIMKSGIT